MPNATHENKIREYQEDGFSIYGFSSFCKLCLATGGKADLKLMSELASKANKENQATMLIRRYTQSIGISDETNVFFDFLHKDTFGEIKSFWNDRLRVVPDAWRFNADENLIEVVEVKYEERVNHRRLAKYAIIDDMLWQKCGHDVRLRLTEVCARDGRSLEHNLERVFNIFEISYIYYPNWSFLKCDKTCKDIANEYGLF